MRGEEKGKSEYKTTGEAAWPAACNNYEETI
jgi:hypothetical protein